MTYLKALNYQFSPKDADTTLFVIDTNYFLYAYQSYYNGESYIKALENKKENLYIPFMVYIEFLLKIDSTIAKLKSEIQHLSKYMTSTVELLPFEEIVSLGLIKDKLKSKSFSIKPDGFSKLNYLLKEDIEKEIDEYVENSLEAVNDQFNEIETILNEKLNNFSLKEKNVPKIEEYETKVKDLTSKIDVLLRHENVLGKEYTEKEISEYVSDMKERFEKNIPPGFSDNNKNEPSTESPKEKIFGELIIPSKAGDLILWKDILDLISQNKERNNKFSNVVIVTDDSISNKKSDWRISLGEKKVVNKHMKIEFYQKTSKNFDLITVEEFIGHFSDDDVNTKKDIANEIQNFHIEQNKENDYDDNIIVFSFLENMYFEENQNEMMKKIFNIVIELKNLSYDDLKDLACVTIESENLNSTFRKSFTLMIHNGEKVLLGTSLNKGDKLRFIYKLFKIAKISYSKLTYFDQELNDLWKLTSQKNITSSSQGDIVILLENNMLFNDYCRISDIILWKHTSNYDLETINNIKEKLVGHLYKNDSRGKILILNDLKQAGLSMEMYNISFEFV